MEEPSEYNSERMRLLGRGKAKLAYSKDQCKEWENELYRLGFDIPQLFLAKAQYLEKNEALALTKRLIKEAGRVLEQIRAMDPLEERNNQLLWGNLDEHDESTDPV